MARARAPKAQDDQTPGEASASATHAPGQAAGASATHAPGQAASASATHAPGQAAGALADGEGALDALESRLGHAFATRALLRKALTHMSGVAGGDPRLGSYQRLEFLGDHVLGLVVSDLLFRAHPEADEGALSRRLAALVRGETCADVARDWGLDRHLVLGPSERRGGLRKATSILGDACEAVIGAVFLDGGYGAAEALVARAWAGRLAEHAAAPPRDGKTMLQEWAQARGWPIPVYREIARSGPDHALMFRIAVDVPGAGTAEGEGRSKRHAEQAAAAAFLAREGLAASGPAGGEERS